MAVFSYKDNAMPQDAIRELSVTRLVIFDTDKEVSPILLSCVSAAITRAEAINITPVYRSPSDMQVRTPTVFPLSSVT